MCVTSPTDELGLLRAAGHAADDMLSSLGVPIRKALDPSTPRGFEGAVVRLAVTLRRFSRQPEADALRSAIAVLDVDWRALTPTRRSELVRLALTAAGRVIGMVHEAIRVPLGKAASEVVSATRTDARRKGLSIAADFNAVDRRAMDYVTRANSLFVRDEYGRRLERLGQKVKRTVAQGLERGLGRDDLAEKLQHIADASLAQPSASYWEVVAASFVGESRSLSQVSAYAEAGIERYVFSAVLDEHTTDTCRYLDGKVFQTADALRTFERLEAAEDPLAIKHVRPWVREKTGEDGKRQLLIEHSGERTMLAVVERSGFGARDDRGEFSRGLSSRELGSLGIELPPLHGLCRSSVLPDV